MSKYDGHPLVQRWAGFISKINGRLGEIEAESHAGLQGLMQQDPVDYLPFSNALGALDARVRQLTDKMDSTWEDSVEPKFDELEDSGIYDHAIQMKTLAELDIEWRWANWKVKEAANFYRNMAPLAEAARNEPRNCTQCGSPLTVPDPTVTQAVTCAGCSAVNQVIPPDALRNYAGAAHAYAEEETAPLREKIERWRQEVDRAQELKRMADDYSNEGVASLEQWAQMERDYWTAHAQAVARHSGKPVDREMIQSRMKNFYVYSLECEQDWVKVHGKKSASM